MGFDVLARTLSTNNKMVIEASAGTGKTFTIEHLFIKRLLEEADDGQFVDPLHIAVITFTKAVAEELTLRIRKALDTAIFSLSHHGENIPDYILHILEQGQEKIVASKRRLQACRSIADRLMITTIHGFCNRLLSEYVAADNDEQAKLVSEEELISIVQDYFRGNLHDNAVDIAQFTSILQAHRSDFSYLTEKIIGSLWKENCDATQDFDGLWTLIQQHRSPHFDEELLALANCFIGCANKSGELHKELTMALCPLMRLFKADFLDDALKTELILHPFFVSDWFLKPKVKAVKLLEEDYGKQNLLSLLQTLESHLRALADPRFLFQALCKKVLHYVRHVMESERLIAYDELLHQVAARTSEPEFIEFLGKRLSCLIVDEFQDTDPLQWKILQACPVRSCFLVGDPKQAIYAFRKADVYCYMEAKKSFNKSDAELFKNYRSSQEVISGLNLMFTGAHSDGLFYLPKLQESIAPKPLLASGKVEELNLEDNKGAVCFFEVQGILGKKRKWPTDTVEDALISFIADELTFLISQGVEPKRMAVLVKDRYQAAKVAEWLAGQKIAASSRSRQSIVGSSAHKMLKRLINACQRPKDRKALITFLAQEPLQIAEKDIFGLLEPTDSGLDCLAEYVQELVALSRIYYEMGLAPFIEAFLQTRWANDTKTIEERILLYPDGQTVLRDLEQLVDRLLEQQFFWGKNLAAVYRELLLLDSLSLYHQEELTSRVSAEDDGVSIMTLFASKGLEFDVVFALGAASRQVIPHPEPDERDAEAIRLFYVAATRAKKRLYIPHLVQQDQKELKPGAASPCELFVDRLGSGGLDALLQRGSGIISHLVVPSMHKNKNKAEEYAFLPIRQSPAACTLSLRSIRSFSGMQVTYNMGHVADSQVPIGKEAGLLLHTLLQTIAFAPVLLEDIDGWLEGTLSGTLFDQHKPYITALIKQAVNTPLCALNDTFTLKDIDWTKAYAEMEFVQEERANSFIRGTVDLAFEHNGRFYLLDYKSHVADGKTVASAYLEQAKIYSKAIKRSNFAGFFFLMLRGDVGNSAVYLSPEELL